MARPQKHASDDVLARATDLFWQRGCDAVSTRDLEAALDLRAPAIYRRYKSKSDLLARSIDHYVDAVVKRRIARVLDAAPSPLDGLHAFFVAMLARHGGEQELRGCLLTNTSVHRDAQDPKVRAALERGLAVIRTAFLTQVRRAIAQGDLDPATDASDLASALFLSLQGLLTLSRMNARDLDRGIAGTFALLGRHPETSRSRRRRSHD